MGTCGSENINCGIGMKRKDKSKDVKCSTCVQNDPNCCEPRKCSDTKCPDTTHTNKGAVLCAICDNDECCVKTPTCKSAQVGCGFGFKYKADQDTTACVTCQNNDLACCDAKTCASNAAKDKKG